MVEKLYDNVYRICIPFEDIYTTAFMFVKGSECIIADSGTTEYDVEEFIIPEISKLGLTPRYLIVSHMHDDHAGGIATLEKYYPNAKSVGIEKGNIADGDILFDRFKVLNLKGHTNDSIGILDIDTNTLFSFDSLQLRGISRYRNGVSDVNEYKKTIDRLRSLNLSRIIASHDYDPYGYIAVGEVEVKRYLHECEKWDVKKQR